jgi:hypothetical protein
MNWMIIPSAVWCVAMVFDAQFELWQGQRMPEQVIREGSFELDMNAGRALQLFTPEGERAWVKGWNPKPVYPAEAVVVFRANSVFRVDQDGEHSLWTIVEADLQKHIAEYIYVVEGERVSRVRVQIEALGEQRCLVRVYYVHTATSQKGRHFVATVTEEVYAQKMRDWHRMVSAAIR